MTMVVRGDDVVWTNESSYNTGNRSLYVIEIGADRIKVGIATNPASRLQDHRSTALMYGVAAGRSWVTPRLAGSVAEGALIDFCAARATERIKREYFVGVRFEAAANRAAELTGYTVDILAGHAYAHSPNAKWSALGTAYFLFTTEAAVRDLVARGELESRDADEPDPVITRRALLNWFETDPDLMSLPRGKSLI